jgi:hypothetical protein
MNDYRRALLSILARLDQRSTEADALLRKPGDTELLPMAEELRELVVDMRAKVGEKLDRVE